MGLIVAVYNFVMFGIDVISMLAVARFRTVRAYLMGLANIGLASLMLSVLLADSVFFGMRLLAYGCFLHLTLGLVIGGCLVDRRRVTIRWLGIMLAILLTVTAVDAFLVEPRWLETERVEISTDQVRRPWRLVLMADLQTDQLSDYERGVFHAVRAAAPDIILMAGDYLQASAEKTPALREQYRRFLDSINFGAPHGVYIVGGNNDGHAWPSMFPGSSVEVFRTSRTVDVDDQLFITGLTLKDSFNPATTVRSQPGFHIVLGHAPDFAMGNPGGDLLLAGHTHGGQVQLPGLGPIITLSQVPRRWASGVTHLGEGKTLIVSRGIGMERGGAPRLRFMCRPQIVVIDLVPAKAD